MWLPAPPRSCRPTASSLIPRGQSGMLLPALGTVIMVGVASAALLANSLAWIEAESRGADAEQARAAAEWGFNTVIDMLNDPGNGHLLATKWSQTENTWVSISDSDLTNCRISTNSTGRVQPSQIVSSTLSSGSTVIRYQLKDFRPPLHPGASPANCSKFGNISGGTARLTIAGEVVRNGKVVTSLEIIREVLVTTVIDNSTTASAVSPPLAYLATGSGASTLVDVENSPSIQTRLALDSSSTRWRLDSNDARMTVHCLGHSEQECRKNSSSLDSGFLVSGYTLSDFTALFPASPPHPPEILQSSWPTATIDKPSQNFFYPYTTENGTTLRNNCRLVRLAPQGGQGEEVIACKIDKLHLEGSSSGQIRSLTVNTNTTPVALYVMDNMYLKNAEIRNKRFIERRHEPGQEISWNRLRIYANPSFQITQTTNPPNCTNHSTARTWTMDAGPSRINGAFIWAPTATLEFKEPSGAAEAEYSMFGAIWACKTKLEKNVRFLSNATSNQTGKAIDGVMGLGTVRFMARGTLTS